MEVDKVLILKKIKSHYNFKKDIEFAAFLGIKPQTLNTWYARNTFDYELLYSKCVNIDANWLLTGKGEMFRPTDEEELKRKRAKINGVPLVSVEALAGFGNAEFSIGQEHVVAYYYVPDFKDADFFAPIKGESMGKDYPPGSIGAYKRIDPSKLIQWGKVHLVATKNDGLLLKRVLPAEEGTGFLLKSDNESFPPIHISKKDTHGLALLLGIIREL